MKKAVALSVLLLANIILLAHAVIPHHHHNQILVIVCGNHHEHDGVTEEHRHHAATHPVSQCTDPDGHCHGAVEDCSLTKIIVRIGNDRQAIQHIDFELSPCMPAFPVHPITTITSLESLPFRQKPHLPLFYTDYISQSLGLRAPPAC